MVPSLQTTARLAAEVAAGGPQLLIHNGDISCAQLRGGAMPPPPLLLHGSHVQTPAASEACSSPPPRLFAHLVIATECHYNRRRARLWVHLGCVLGPAGARGTPRPLHDHR